MNLDFGKSKRLSFFQFLYSVFNQVFIQKHTKIKLNIHAVSNGFFETEHEDKLIRARGWSENLRMRGASNNVVGIKEGCNRGHVLSAAIKLGSLEKTIFLHSGVGLLWRVLSIPLFVEKTQLHNLQPSQVIVCFSTKKDYHLFLPN